LFDASGRRTIYDWQPAPKKRVVGLNDCNVSDSPIKDRGIMKWSAMQPTATPFWTVSCTPPIIELSGPSMRDTQQDVTDKSNLSNELTEVIPDTHTTHSRTTAKAKKD
jgi:hypothetical protein